MKESTEVARETRFPIAFGQCNNSKKRTHSIPEMEWHFICGCIFNVENIKLLFSCGLMWFVLFVELYLSSFTKRNASDRFHLHEMNTHFVSSFTVLPLKSTSVIWICVASNFMFSLDIFNTTKNFSCNFTLFLDAYYLVRVEINLIAVCIVWHYLTKHTPTT